MVNNCTVPNNYVNYKSLPCIMKPLTVQHMMSSLFSKGIIRLILFKNFLQGQKINGDNIRKWNELSMFCQ